MKKIGIVFCILFLAAMVSAQKMERLPGPELLSPQNGDVLDNGCSDKSDPEEWKFKWKEIPDASRYHLWVIHHGARIAMLNVSSVGNTSYRFYDYGYIAQQNLDDWMWSVRALVRGHWTEWSEIRTFSVEPTNTDCPRSKSGS